MPAYAPNADANTLRTGLGVGIVAADALLGQDAGTIGLRPVDATNNPLVAGPLTVPGIFLRHSFQSKDELERPPLEGRSAGVLFDYGPRPAEFDISLRLLDDRIFPGAELLPGFTTPEQKLEYLQLLRATRRANGSRLAWQIDFPSINAVGITIVIITGIAWEETNQKNYIDAVVSFSQHEPNATRLGAQAAAVPATEAPPDSTVGLPSDTSALDTAVGGF